MVSPILCSCSYLYVAGFKPFVWATRLLNTYDYTDACTQCQQVSINIFNMFFPKLTAVSTFVSRKAAPFLRAKLEEAIGRPIDKGFWAEAGANAMNPDIRLQFTMLDGQYDIHFVFYVNQIGDNTFSEPVSLDSVRVQFSGPFGKATRTDLFRSFIWNFREDAEDGGDETEEQVLRTMLSNWNRLIKDQMDLQITLVQQNSDNSPIAADDMNRIDRLEDMAKTRTQLYRALKKIRFKV